jgi:microcystin-dependent protein
MPRDSQGQYSLPPGNPVTPNTIIESEWANSTMSDLADSMTGSLPRDGSAAMTGGLTLAPGFPTNPRFAASKLYVDSFLAYASGMPVGSLLPYAGAAAPSGFLLCNGQAVARNAYPALFTAIGTAYGSGDGTTTFNVPDMRDYFVRGRGTDRTIGSKQDDSLGKHTHVMTDPGHTHTIVQTPHTHIADTHEHTLTDPGHVHGPALHTCTYPVAEGTNYNAAYGWKSGSTAITSAVTGVTIAPGNVTLQPSSVTATVNNAMTGITVAETGATETRPKNIALDYYIKAVADSAGNPPIQFITSSDAGIISVDTTVDGTPTSPILSIHSNTPYGTVKLGADGRIPSALLPVESQLFLGMFDASGGLNPTEAFPTQVYHNGDTYLVIVAGNILLYDSLTGLETVMAAAVGSNIVYLDNLTQPVGWYYVPPTATHDVVAVDVALAPIPNVAATNVQDAIQELHDVEFIILDSMVTTTGVYTLENKTMTGDDNVFVDPCKYAEFLTGVGGTENAITANANPLVIHYGRGQRYNFIALAENSGDTTININAIGVKHIYKNGAEPLVAGDIKLGQVVTIINDGTNFQLSSGAGSGVNVPVGGGNDRIFWNNGVEVTENYDIPADTNSGSFGPITVAAGKTVTVPTGSTWSIV